jgi:SAM-dependent methyltransferase
LRPRPHRHYVSYRLCADAPQMTQRYYSSGKGKIGERTKILIRISGETMATSNPGDNSFNEREYLLANPDVADAVRKRLLESGRRHYEIYGKYENRRMRPTPSTYLVNFRNVLRYYVTDRVRRRIPWPVRRHVDMPAGNKNKELRPSDPIGPLNFRNILRYYLTGNGIEIGALHNPLDISGLPVASIKYVDRSTTEELVKEHPEFGDAKLVHVDIIDNGEVLDQIENESLDFIIANHFIEHARNPMGTIGKWLSKLRSGGIIFMAVPEKSHTFDKDREVTPLEHLIADYGLDPQDPLIHDKQHFIEWTTLVLHFPADRIESYANSLVETNYSIHFHTFTLQSFLEMLNYLKQERKLPFVIKACADIIHESNEFFAILMRE